jgi:predicted Zn finger-like uncharacterized protein
MFTVCPKCALTLAVTAADLRAGQGYVRCGRCANVFNALLGLSDESGPSTIVQTPTLHQGPAPAHPTLDPSLPVAAAPQSPPPAPVPLAAPTPAPVSAPVPAPRALPSNPVDLEVEEFRGTGTFETIVLEGDTFLQTEEQVAEEAVDIELADVSRRIEAARDAGDLARFGAAPPQEAAEQATEEEEEDEDEEEQDESVEDEAEEWGPAPRGRTGWLGLSALLLLILVLAAQAINHWRNDLATYVAWYGPLNRLTAAVGEPLSPNWDLSAYDVHQLGASSDTSDPRVLTVRVSLANRGPRAQALPLLRLNLLDRFGAVVNSGDLKAEEYLPAALRGQHFIASEQRIDTQVSVVDPTQRVSSFELDVCVAAAGGGLRCAGDTPVLSSVLSGRK